MENKNPTDLISKILDDRSVTHGNFKDNAVLAIEMRQMWRSAPNWEHLSPELQLVLDEIALKIARILSGGDNVYEHLVDIAGYAVLATKKEYNK
jgi:hypothetical protein